MFQIQKFYKRIIYTVRLMLLELFTIIKN